MSNGSLKQRLHVLLERDEAALRVLLQEVNEKGCLVGDPTNLKRRLHEVMKRGADDLEALLAESEKAEDAKNWRCMCGHHNLARETTCASCGYPPPPPPPEPKK